MTFTKSLIRILALTSFAAFCIESKLEKKKKNPKLTIYIQRLYRLKILAENLLDRIAVCREQRAEKKKEHV